MIGGICYRAYKEEKFAEIAFCAVQASQQVKGYGSVVMNLLKEQGLREGIEVRQSEGSECRQLAARYLMLL